MLSVLRCVADSAAASESIEPPRDMPPAEEALKLLVLLLSPQLSSTSPVESRPSPPYFRSASAASTLLFTASAACRAIGRWLAGSPLSPPRTPVLLLDPPGRCSTPERCPPPASMFCTKQQRDPSNYTGSPRASDWLRAVRQAALVADSQAHSVSCSTCGGSWLHPQGGY